MRSPSTSTIHSSQRSVFWVLVGVSFLSLVGYRLLAHYPVWFDEIFAKALLFGAPALLFGCVAKRSSSSFGIEPKRFWPGALLGLALGGCFGSVALLLSALQRTHVFIPNLFSAPLFWYEFALAFATSWWESLFFYGFVTATLQSLWKNEWKSAWVTTGLFVLFHAPVLFLSRGAQGALVPLLLLACFAFGQAILFLRYRSLPAIIVSHAFWGMALLVYTLH